MALAARRDAKAGIRVCISSHFRHFGFNSHEWMDALPRGNECSFDVDRARACAGLPRIFCSQVTRKPEPKVYEKCTYYVYRARPTSRHRLPRGNFRNDCRRISQPRTSLYSGPCTCMEIGADCEQTGRKSWTRGCSLPVSLSEVSKFQLNLIKN